MELEDKIIEYINSDNNYAIMIDGEWGIGKTFYIKKVLKKIENSIYISLNGVSTINSLSKILYVEVLKVRIFNNIIFKFIYKRVNKIEIIKRILQFVFKIIRNVIKSFFIDQNFVL